MTANNTMKSSSNVMQAHFEKSLIKYHHVRLKGDLQMNNRLRNSLTFWDICLFG